MNIEPRNPLDEREWQAQERARLQASNARAAAGSADDGQATAYRAIARALRQPLRDALPLDFATRVAEAAAAGSARVPARTDTHLERRLLQALACALVVAATMTVVVYGDQWLPALLLLLPAQAWGWILALGGCLLSTLLLEQKHRRSKVMPCGLMR